MNDPTVLKDKWDIYYHFPGDANWNLDSYKPIMLGLEWKEHIAALNQEINPGVIKNCMLFVMRNNITPRWEDERNRNGGCFSYKVSNKCVVNTWRQLFTEVCSEQYTTEPIQSHINGITISPKKNFCIVKVWMDSNDYKDPKIFNTIPNLNAADCLFKEHQPTN